MHSPFDILAKTYDADFTYTNIGQFQRKQVWEDLHAILRSGASKMQILEINCGTGEDAIALTRLGHTVIATDASETMIETARLKASSQGLENIQFQLCPFNDLEHHFPRNHYDLIISNFGGLNCIDSSELTALTKNLAGLLKKEGRLFFVIMSSCCLWEIFYYSLKGRLGLAFRRRKTSVLFHAGQQTMPIFYYSPMKLKRLLKPHYTFKGVRPVGLFVPPSYLEKTFEHKADFLERLARLDKRCREYSILSNLADHFCIIFQKREKV